MNLPLITLLNGAFFVGLGICFFWRPPTVEMALKQAPRSPTVTWVLSVVATAWFLLHISQLGEADYGNYRHYLLMGFFGLAVASAWVAPDFLAVRAGCVLLLLVANENLGAAYMQWDYPQRLVLVVVSYAAILLALYLAISPFRVRDFLQWVFGGVYRSRFTGAATAAVGLLLAGVSMSY